MEDLKEGGFLASLEDYQHSVGRCYRCSTVIEPLISRQWFVRMKELAEPAIEAVRDGRINIVPRSWEKTYFEWMNNIRDWCISRQIWWGHRIPVWTCQSCNEVVVQVDEPQACPGCDSKELVQEDDVLDTWFSSALWPFSTMGWPGESKTLEKFYPTSCLVTGFDILFFWVARMIMMGIKFMGDVPFRHVYIHALVRDAEGRKMSKSLGNIIDPLVIIEKFGADAFRFTLAAFAAMGRDIRLDEDRIEGYRHFVNKIWNAAKLVLQYTDEITTEQIESGIDPAELHNRWIRSRLDSVVELSTQALEDYRFNDMAETLYQFFWHEFCDWYLELAKPSLYGSRGDESRTETAITAASVLEISLRMLHPVMPFLTEDIWQNLPVEGESIMIASYPESDKSIRDEASEEAVQILQDFITGIRNLRSEMGIVPSVTVTATVVGSDKKVRSILEDNMDDILRLARLDALEVSDTTEIPEDASTTVVRGQEIFIPFPGSVDVEAERDRIGRELQKITSELEKVQSKLSNAQFLEKAPSQVVQKNRGIAEELRTARDKLRVSLERLGA